MPRPDLGALARERVAPAEAGEEVAGVAESAAAAQPFGCEPCEWVAELSAMSLGGLESHVTVPLQLRDPGVPSEPVRLGRYQIRVVQCVGHHVRQVVRRAERDGARAENVPDGQDRGEAGRPPSPHPAGRFWSDYPLLLLHAQVALSRVFF